MNEHLFSRRQHLYHQSRPGYPAALFEALKARALVHPQMRAAEFGCGTGIFTRQLSCCVKEVAAMDPNPDMLEKARVSLRDCAHVTLLPGSGEHCPLPDHWADCAFAAQAFHWFDRRQFKIECRRILKPKAPLILIWNQRDPRSVLIQRNEALNRDCCPQFKGFSNGLNLDDPTVFRDLFDYACPPLIFDHPQRMDRDTFLQRNLSSSFAPHPHDPAAAQYLAGLNELFDTYSHGGFLIYPYRTLCFIGNLQTE